MNHRRQEVLQSIASIIISIDTNQPLLVGIDGKDASGKTTFANSIADVLSHQTNRQIIRISLDNFFQPRSIRSQQIDQALGCYEDTFNNAAIVTHLFDAIRSHNTYTKKIFDYESDTAIDIVTHSAPLDAIFVIDGVFLQRPEFREYWNYSILLDVSDTIAINRGAARDSKRLGDVETARQKYINRYIASQKIYFDECHPTDKANIIVDNSDFEAPIILKNNASLQA